MMWKACLLRVRAFLRRDGGMTTAQYAIVTALLAAVLLTSAVHMGKRTRKAFKTLPAPGADGS